MSVINLVMMMIAVLDDIYRAGLLPKDDHVVILVYCKIFSISASVHKCRAPFTYKKMVALTTNSQTLSDNFQQTSHNSRRKKFQ